MLRGVFVGVQVEIDVALPDHGNLGNAGKIDKVEGNGDALAVREHMRLPSASTSWAGVALPWKASIRTVALPDASS